MTKKKKKQNKSLDYSTPPAKLREEFPEELIKIYVKLVDSEFETKMYKKYVGIAKQFLKLKWDDPINQCGLIVRLAKATFDLVGKKNVKDENKKDAKQTKKLARGKRPPKKVRANEGQKKGRKQKSVQAKRRVG
jgi:hypothetical protein